MEIVRESIPPSQRIRILVRDGFRCVYCGATREDAKIEVDHVIPVAAGGTNDDGNLVAACWPCNRGKRDKLILDVMESDVGLYVKKNEQSEGVAVVRRELAQQEVGAVPLAATRASMECACLKAAWEIALSQWWPEVLPGGVIDLGDALPPDTNGTVAICRQFLPTFICRGRSSCDIGPEVRVLVVPFHSVGCFSCEEQLQIRNAAISGYDVPTMILMGPPEFFYGIVVNERHKGVASGRVIDGLLQPVGEWISEGWYPDENLDFQDPREPFFDDPRQLALRDFDGDDFVGVYSSIYREEGEANGI